MPEFSAITGAPSNVIVVRVPCPQHWAKTESTPKATNWTQRDWAVLMITISQLFYYGQPALSGSEQSFSTIWPFLLVTLQQGGDVRRRSHAQPLSDPG